MPRTRKTVDQQLADLSEKEKQLKARKADLQARKRQNDRKADTRRKIVAGGAVFAHAERDPQFADLLAHVLDRAVTREQDRELLGLEPKKEAASEKFQPAAGTSNG